MMKNKRLLLIALLSAVLAGSISAQKDWQGEGSKQMMLEGQDDLAVKKKVEHTFSLNGNLGLITSKVTTPRGTYSWQVGYGFEGSYRCVFKKGFGFALSYMYSKTGYPVSSFYKDHGDIELTFLGPSFVYAGAVGEDWSARVEFGLGRASYSGDYSQNGLGTKIAVGVERRLWKYVGIGLDMVSTTSTFKKEPGQKLKDNEKNGFARLAFNLGLRLYL